MLSLLLSSILALPMPTLKWAEDQVSGSLRGCYIEKRFTMPGESSPVFTFWRCGGPPNEPRSYQVGFVFARDKHGFWNLADGPLVEMTLERLSVPR